MWTWLIILIAVAVVLIVVALSIRIVQQYERGVVFRLGKVIAEREPGLHVIIPIADKMTMMIVAILLAAQALLPIWLAVVIVLRDAIIVAGAVAYRFVVGHIEMAPTRLSKANTFLEFGVLALATVAGRRVAAAAVCPRFCSGVGVRRPLRLDLAPQGDRRRTAFLRRKSVLAERRGWIGHSACRSTSVPGSSASRISCPG